MHYEKMNKKRKQSGKKTAVDKNDNDVDSDCIFSPLYCTQNNNECTLAMP